MTKGAIDRLAVVRGHKLRREIMQAAEEAHVAGRLVSPKGLHKQLGGAFGTISYHVVVLRDAGALKLLDEVPRRGASEHLYGINEDFLAEIGDSVALDQLAELMDDYSGPRGSDTSFLGQLRKVIRATGRPVEA